MNSNELRTKLKGRLKESSELSRLLGEYLQELRDKALSDAGLADDMRVVRRAQGKVAVLKTIRAQLLGEENE